MYTDLTGRFQVAKKKRMQYMLIIYAFDTNTVLVEPTKTRSDEDILRTYDILYYTL